MTLEEAKAAIEDLKAQGETEDDILKVLYGMFTEDKLSLSDLRTFIGILGYEFTEEFEAMSDEDKKTKGWEQEDDPEKSGMDKEEIEKAKEFGDDEGEEEKPEEPEIPGAAAEAQSAPAESGEAAARPVDDRENGTPEPGKES